MKIKGFASQNRSVQPTCRAKDILHLYRTELHDFLQKKLLERWLEPISSRVLKSFPTEKFHDFQRCSGGIRHTQVGQGDGNNRGERLLLRPGGRESNENLVNIQFLPKRVESLEHFSLGSKKKWPLSDGPKWWITKIILGSHCNWQTALNDLFEVNASVRKWVLQVRISHCFFWGGTWRPKFRPTQVLTWMAFS